MRAAFGELLSTLDDVADDLIVFVSEGKEIDLSTSVLLLGFEEIESGSVT